MVVQIGRRVNVGLGKETTRGTPVTATAWVPKTDVAFNPKVEKKVDESSMGNIHDALATDVTMEHSEGTIEMNAAVNSVGLLLLSTMGAVTSTVDTT